MDNENNENIQIENQTLDTLLQNKNNEIQTKIDVIGKNEINSLNKIFFEKIKNLQILIKRESANQKICKYHI